MSTTATSPPSGKLVDVEDSPSATTTRTVSNVSVDEMLLTDNLEEAPATQGEAKPQSSTKKYKSRRSKETSGTGSIFPTGSVLAIGGGLGGMSIGETKTPATPKPTAPANPTNVGEARAHLLEHPESLAVEPGPGGPIRQTLSEQRYGGSWAKFTWGLSGYELHVHYTAKGGINSNEVKVVKSYGGGEAYLDSKELSKIRSYLNIGRG
jgi:hypothetical protein